MRDGSGKEENRAMAVGVGRGGGVGLCVVGARLPGGVVASGEEDGVAVLGMDNNGSITGAGMPGRGAETGELSGVAAGGIAESDGSAVAGAGMGGKPTDFAAGMGASPGEIGTVNDGRSAGWMPAVHQTRESVIHNWVIIAEEMEKKRRSAIHGMKFVRFTALLFAYLSSPPLSVVRQFLFGLRTDERSFWPMPPGRRARYHLNRGYGNHLRLAASPGRGRAELRGFKSAWALVAIKRLLVR